MIFRPGLWAAERGLLPNPVVRLGIRRLLAARLRKQRVEQTNDPLILRLRQEPVALQPDKPNEQHYEVPAAFFQLVLGPHLKYSAALWGPETRSLSEAEARMLRTTCARAELEDGQDVLELGCGWGSLSLHMAEHYPNSRIVAVSNSASQRAYIDARRPSNLRVVTADVNVFEACRQFDRIVSVEMFEHMRNYETLLRRIAGWLRSDGKLFVHIFCHRRHAYPFETTAEDDWMGRYFFTGGLMPSLDLLPAFDDDLTVEDRWVVGGEHYRRTAAAWRRNLERQRSRVLDVLRDTYGEDSERWYHRWRLFFLACEELFGYRGGTEWLVAHYRFTHAAVPASAKPSHGGVPSIQPSGSGITP